MPIPDPKLVSEGPRVLECPKCGAPLPTEAERATVVCEFCKAAVAPAPPALSTAAERRARQSTPQAASRVTDLKCPRCSVELFEGQTSNAVLYGCGTCGGVWLDNEASQRIVRTVDKEVAELATRAQTHASCTVDTVRGGLLCPECERPLRRVHFDQADLDLDICATHGTWFDQGELQKVMNASAGQNLPKLPAYAPMAVAVPDGHGGYISEAEYFRRGAEAGLAPAVVAGGAFAIVGALLGSRS